MPHPLLTGFVLELRAVGLRLFAYLCGLGMLALIATDLCARITGPDAGPAPAATALAATEADWTRASRPDRAFAVTALDLPSKSETYETFRRPDGGRRDVLRWQAEDGREIADIMVERPGTLGLAPAPEAFAARLSLADGGRVEPAGLVATKFGNVRLWRAAGAPACLGFSREFDAPRLRLSGFACAPAGAMRAGPIGCSLDRLTLLSAGNNPELAALFARAELKRGSCGVTQSASADWVTDAAPPRLRGRL